MAVSPDGTTAYLSVSSDVAPGADWDTDAFVLAYDTKTGSLRWAGRYAGTLPHASGRGLAVSPDGRRVYATSELRGDGVAAGAVTAFDALDGTLLWSRPMDVAAREVRLVTAPGGGDRLLLSLHRRADEQRAAMGVLALDVSEAGAEPAWERLWRASSPWGTTGGRLAVSADGTRVFLGGGENGDDGLRRNFGTVAYDAATGEQLWEAVEDMSDPEGFFSSNGVSGLAVAPDGSSVYAVGFDPVTGSNQISDLEPSTSAIVTFAYDAQTGQRRWSTRYLGDSGTGFYFNLFEHTIDVAPDGSSVAVVADGGPELRYFSGSTTVLYDAETGAIRWVGADGDPKPVGSGYVGYYPQLAFSGDGKSVVVTEPRGLHSTMASVTTSYGASDGAKEWAARFSVGSTYPRAIVAAPGRVLIPTLSRTVQTSFPVPNPGVDSVDVLVLAYDT